jgi:sarcosine/dimethylglycine N-methyltransferase
MTMASETSIDDVRAVYDGREGDLWELIFGQQIHIGGFKSSMELAERAAIGAGQKGVDLCCCNGAGMRFLTRFRNVASMTGIDTAETVIARGTVRCAEEGLAQRIGFVHADVCDSGLAGGEADFVWGEDAWCYVVDKSRLIEEAARIVRPGGTIAFTDWIEGPAGLSADESKRLFAFMKFPGVQNLEGYKALLEANGCEVVAAENTERFAPYVDLYIEMIDKQLTYDALRILNFDMDTLQVIGEEFGFLRGLAHAEKMMQGLFVARRR